MPPRAAPTGGRSHGRGCALCSVEHRSVTVAATAAAEGRAARRKEVPQLRNQDTTEQEQEN